MSETNSSKVVVALCSATFSSLLAFFISEYYHGVKQKAQQADDGIHKNKTDVQTEDEKSKDEPRNHELGPECKPEVLYQLNLRGKIDRLYQKYDDNGGRIKPFRFDEEVVPVFDDMISRSVPLYCEVMDLAIYWVQRYYKPGTRIYDLGCSTGTTIDVLARYFYSVSNDDIRDNSPADFGKNKGEGENDDILQCHFVGVDNSRAMVQSCREKLEWAQKYHHIDIYCDDLLKVAVVNSSFVIMNYTLQFIPIVHRQELLSNIHKGLLDGGVFYLSEKVRAECSELQETCTWIYEDFKQRRKYTKREIARKKEALMNVLIPFTEEEIRNALYAAGFASVEVIAKWNNFTTFIARKALVGNSLYSKSKANPSTKQKRQKKNLAPPKTKISTPHLDSLFDSCPDYLSDLVEDSKTLHALCLKRIESFYEKGGLSNHNLVSYDKIAKLIHTLPQLTSTKLIVNESEVTIGDPSELSEEAMITLRECVDLLKPWRKGPFNLFGIHIDAEWRSDWKWKRLQESLPDLQDKVVCDLGCGNGYFMYRMMEYQPKLVVGIDPNMHAFLEFELFARLRGINNLHFEYLRGDVMASFVGAFDVVYCLGVLYHTPDPIGMLKDIYKSMKGNATLIVDCQGIDGDDHIALFPQKRYTNMKGVFFLPTLNTLRHWLQRAQFLNFEVIFNEELSTDEQRTTDWAPVRSLEESLDPNDSNKTIEGYPRARRFYVRVRK